MVKVIYLSFAQNKKIDPKKLGLSADIVGIRGGQGIWEDPMFQDHYASVIASGLPFFIWWFCQPNMNGQLQVDAFMKLWNSLEVKPAAIAYDVEEIDYIDDNGTYQKLFPPSRQFSHDNTLYWCKKIAELTGAKVGIYTRKNYFEAWTFETDEWYQFWMWIAAWYLYTGNVKPLLPWKWPDYKIHQYEGGSYDPNIGVYTCKEYFNGTLEECNNFFGGKETTPMTAAQIHDVNVSLADRAWVIEVKADQKVNGGYAALGADAIILPMVNMPWDGNHQTIAVEGTFKGRCAEVNAASLAVFGKIKLDAGWVTTEMHTKGELDGHSVWQNLVIQRIIDAWHIGDWAPNTLHVDDFLPVSMLIFEMTTESDHRTPAAPIEDFWQGHFFKYATDKLQSLMSTGVIPNVPIVLKTTSRWLQKYSSMLTALSSRKSWLYLALHDQRLDSTATHADLWSIYQWAVWSTFKYSFVPDGYADRVVLFSFSEDKQSVKAITDAAGVPTPGRFMKYCRGLEAMKADLKLPVIEPPIEPPPPVSTLEARVVVLEEQVKLLDERLSYVEGKITKAVQAAVEAIKIIAE